MAVPTRKAVTATTAVQPTSASRPPAAEPADVQGPRRGEPTPTVAVGRGRAPEFSLELNQDQLQIQEWVHDFPVERWHRDAKIFTLFEGTSEIQRLTIARAISGVRIR